MDLDGTSMETVSMELSPSRRRPNLDALVGRICKGVSEIRRRGMRCTAARQLHIHGFWPAVGRFLALAGAAGGATGPGAGSWVREQYGTHASFGSVRALRSPSTTDHRPARHVMNTTETKDQGSTWGRVGRSSSHAPANCLKRRTSTNTYTLTVAHHASPSNMCRHPASSAYKQPRTHTREQRFATERKKEGCAKGTPYRRAPRTGKHAHKHTQLKTHTTQHTHN